MQADKWDLRFLELARTISEWSKDPSTKTGAVLVAQDRRILGTGYNGFAPGVEDSEERLADREVKYRLTVHCEKNAVLSAQSARGATLYTWPFMSCAPCAAFMIRAGIVRAVAPWNQNPRWAADFVWTRVQFQEAGVELLEVRGYYK